MIAVTAGWLGSRLARRSPAVWRPAAIACAGLMLFWPMMRLFPARMLHVLGSNVLIFVEVTGIVIPAAMLLTIASRHVRRDREGRWLYLLLAVCGLYFLRHASWMITPGVPDLGPTRFDGRVCLQSTGYTCVPASLVTLLSAHGIDASETEMARLSHVLVGRGTTDSHAVWALERKLAGRPIEVRYEMMDYRRLLSVPKPCIVPIDWGYFVSHMVPVLAANDDHVVLGDPLTGARVLQKEAFIDQWRGRGIFLRATGPGGALSHEDHF